MISKEEKEPTTALLIGLSAYVIWGFLPLYLKQMQEVSPWVITANRILWTIPWAAGLALVFHGKKYFRINYHTFFMLSLSAFFIGANWTIYAWAVSNNQIMETALGYYINPLMNVGLGMLFFGEKLNRIKTLAIFLAALGVLNQIIVAQHFPVLGLSLAALFAGYGLVRKKVAVAPAVGLFWESLALAPFAALGLWFMGQNGVPVFGASKADKFWLLLAGPLTAVPLILFAFGARNLRLATIGMLQYIAPSIAFCISIFYGEAFGISHAITFALIWAGLAVYTWDEFRAKN